MATHPARRATMKHEAPALARPSGTRGSLWLLCVAFAMLLLAGCDTGVGSELQIQGAGHPDAGVDAPTCRGKSTECNGTCVDTASDNGNCGACGKSCGKGE